MLEVHVKFIGQLMDEIRGHDDECRKVINVSGSALPLPSFWGQNKIKID